MSPTCTLSLWNLQSARHDMHWICTAMTYIRLSPATEMLQLVSNMRNWYFPCHDMRFTVCDMQLNSTKLLFHRLSTVSNLPESVQCKGWGWYTTIWECVCVLTGDVKRNSRKIHNMNVWHVLTCEIRGCCTSSMWCHAATCVYMRKSCNDAQPSWHDTHYHVLTYENYQLMVSPRDVVCQRKIMRWWVVITWCHDDQPSCTRNIQHSRSLYNTVEFRDSIL